MYPGERYGNDMKLALVGISALMSKRAARFVDIQDLKNGSAR